MQKRLNSPISLSPSPAQHEKKMPSDDIATWNEYLSFHDTFTELLSYENSRKTSSDFWQLNYI